MLKTLLTRLDSWSFGYLCAMGLLLRCSDAPDTSGQQAAAIKTAELGERAMNWYEKAYEDQAPERAAAAKRAAEVSDAQLGAMNTQTRIAEETDAYNRGTFRPLEQGIVADAQNFDTAAERERRAGLAGADIAQSFGAARGQLTRNLGRAGVNPADGKMLSMEKDLAASEALGRGFAMNKSRADSETLARALKMDAASLGRNLPSQQAAAATTAINAGNASAASGLTPLQIAQSGTAQMGQGFQTAIQGNNASGNLYGNIANIQAGASASNDQTMGALGSAAGTAALMFLSDENEKEQVQPTSDEEALDAVAATPVKNWRYKEGSPAADGGMEHTGPMAQDVNKHMGGKAAPGGKMIDLVSMNGITMKAVQAVNKKVDKLAAAMGVPA
jgi:hypothetical protein